MFRDWAPILRLVVFFALSTVAMVGTLAVGFYLPAVGAKTYWLISRSSGLVAYGLITCGVLWGLIQSGSLFRGKLHPAITLGMHSFLSWLGLGFAALHGLILIGDSYINIDLPRVFLPFVAEYRPIPVGLGIISFYLMLLLTLSFYARSHLSQTTFRTLHYGSFLAFITVTIHAIFSGTDSGSLWYVYVTSMIAVVALTALRIVSTFAARRRRYDERQVPGVSHFRLVAVGGVTSQTPKDSSQGRPPFRPLRRR
jgi:hypothetical protein